MQCENVLENAHHQTFCYRSPSSMPTDADKMENDAPWMDSGGSISVLPFPIPLPLLLR